MTKKRFGVGIAVPATYQSWGDQGQILEGETRELNLIMLLCAFSEQTLIPGVCEVPVLTPVSQVSLGQQEPSCLP